MLIEEHSVSSVLILVEIDRYLLILKKKYIIKQNFSKKKVTKIRQIIYVGHTKIQGQIRTKKTLIMLHNVVDC